MVYRIYVEKKPAFREAAQALYQDIRSFLRIDSLEGLRIVNRYDVEGIDPEHYEKSLRTIFSEPQLDDLYEELPGDGARIFATEYLPGQYDQRADSAAQCVQLAFQCERPLVRTATVYLLYGELSDDEYSTITKYLMNPVESREASLDVAETLAMKMEIPESVETLHGFTELDAAGLAEVISKYALAMDQGDIQCCQDYFRAERRDPTLTEIRMLDTYWSDHCRHTTFLTVIDGVEIQDPVVEAAYGRYLQLRDTLNREKPITLMDIATIGARYLKSIGLLTDEDESEEINACTIRVPVDVDGEDEEWILLFKNETHNHPTEIEPFGGAATCIGGAIRDPLSGRGYVYQAMRVTGAANPLRPVEQTFKGKLPQKKLTVTAANGYSSYGNQIGLATGQVDEIYHDGYQAKRMEIGAVLGAAPRKNVVRERPAPGDQIVLLGGRTGRDGLGGATGSSKSHSVESLETCSAEVQKGNAPEERKLQRLMRNPEASRLIKRCNDFGAGGVSVAIGELADGLKIDLNAVPKKYEGLDGTELAISESQERMAVVLDAKDVDAFNALADSENLEATVVAEVTGDERLTMVWNGQKIVDIARAFLNSNGAEKRARVAVAEAAEIVKDAPKGSLAERFTALSKDLNICSKRGLSERFDSTIGSGSVLMPFGGKYQRTPVQAMVAKLPVLGGETTTVSAMAWGYNPFIMEVSPYRGAYLAVVESLAKLAAAGAGVINAHLTFQEYFERLRDEPSRWGKPFEALLGALDAQVDLGCASIGGKDSMSGSFEALNVPPTLVSFAVNTAKVGDIISPEFKSAHSKVYLLSPSVDQRGLPDAESLKANFAVVAKWIKEKKVCSAWALGYGGLAEGLMKMAFGNRVGFAFDEGYAIDAAFGYDYGALVLEAADSLDQGVLIGTTTEVYAIQAGAERVDLAAIEASYEGELESVFPSEAPAKGETPTAYEYEVKTRAAASVKIARPRALIPVFPGTNCEYDSARALLIAGIEPEIFVVRNLTSAAVAESADVFAKRIDNSQIIFLPGGFSGGDEPEGSGKFITAFFRNPRISESVRNLLWERDGLMAGVCNGFQALIKLGLLPYGEIRETDEHCPTLTYNRIGRHQSRLVRTRVCSNKSPWLSEYQVGEVTLMPVSHGEGRFICEQDLLNQLAMNGQIATQYVGLDGRPSMDITVNPNGSVAAIEGITSPDGRILGKMGHSERHGDGLHKNVPGQDDRKLFDGAAAYYR